jgi:simple sugar transport system ATP-binding protein
MPDQTGVAVRLEGITKRFGDVVANDGVDFTLQQGTVHALVGENGAGKTTLMNILYGLYDPDEGSIHVDGRPRSFDSPREALDAGIGMIHQHFMLVETMTVLQNVVLGHEPGGRLGIVDTAAAEKRVREICAAYGFDVDDQLGERIADVGVGVQQRVEIIKALYRGADTLVLDEPTAVLTPQEVDRLYQVMAELTAEGNSIIFITHKLEEAMAAADRITVLQDGETVGTVDADATSQAELARMMVGRDVLFDVEDRAHDVGEPVVEVRDLRVSDDQGVEQVSGPNFTVREGEVFGIAGVEGNGQIELVEAITGLRTPDDGQVLFRGREITDSSRRDRIESGVAYVPEDRQESGIVMDYDLIENALLGNQTLDPFADGQWLDWTAVEDHAEAIIEEYEVQTPDATTEARSLSGGNQQKFIVGREFKHDPDLVVAAHPTRGVDVGSIEFIHQRLLEMRDEGTAVLLVSSKLDEIQKLSDRIAVAYEGSFTDVVDPDGVTKQDLGLLMTGRQPVDDSTRTEVDEGKP